MTHPIYQIPLTRLDGRATTLGKFKGEVLLIVNVASQCGLTPQYAALEALYQNHRQRGLQVLGFPCNDFAGQEPGSSEEIQNFCSKNYGVQFPLFARVHINSQPRHPLYAHLIAAQPQAVAPENSDFAGKLAQHNLLPAVASDVMWNFEKFLVGRDGAVLARFAPDMPPDHPRLLAAIEAALS
jgi:glutathione peroxidase